MEHAWSNSRLRYVDAGKLQHSRVDFEGLDVRSAAGEKLGDVEGFVYDAASSRPYYIVVDSGGWFTSRQFLLPIGHAALDSDARALITDVGKDQIGKYPEFHPERFAAMKDEDVRAYQQRMVEACCTSDAATRAASDEWGFDTYPHYRQPDWWDARFQPTADLGGVKSVPVSTSSTEYDRERLVAHGDTSPHFEGRAQPGDILGIETGGERTGIGDSAEDENERRAEAEKDARKD
jgi:PRC-barrel domain